MEELDKITILTIHGSRIPIDIKYEGLLDFEEGEIISLHNIRGIRWKYRVRKPVGTLHHELIGYPKSSDCLVRNYDLEPIETIHLNND